MSLFEPFVKIVSSVIRTIKGGMKVTDLLLSLVGVIGDVLVAVRDLKSANPKEIIDASLDEFDKLTGADRDVVLGVNLIPDLPNEHAEAAYDHFKEFLRILCYNKAKVAGYYNPES